MSHADIIAQTLGFRAAQAAAVIELLDEGNTLPFIARYRKEKTGSLDEEQIRNLQEMLERLRALDERRASIVSSIEEQGKMTPELLEKINTANTMTELEDLYQPYKPRRRTKAAIAREKGLQGLADQIILQVRTNQSLDSLVTPFLNEQVESIEDALEGARDIVAETISDSTEVRSQARQKIMQWGSLHVEKVEDAKDEKETYQIYYAFEGKIERLRPYQILAINRGEKENVLKIKLICDERDWLGPIQTYFKSDRRSIFFDQLNQACIDAAERLLLPAIERDIRRMLSEKAEEHAIHVFATNLRGLLSQPPLADKVVMGIDPGFRTGSKVAVVDATGKVLETLTIYPHEPQKKWDESLKILKGLVEKHHVSIISIGNGTASRETEQLAAELIKSVKNVLYLITSEAGASVYSASQLARAELPGLDVSIRGAVSIARRVQDPLAELVKIEPKAIGIGLYQHDVDQGELTHSLGNVVESVVNSVGVDVNSASPALLTYVAGIGPKLAEKIVAYRDENGVYKKRADLKKVSGLGPKAFEQSAGFLRIRDAEDVLDSSAIHPESYQAARAVLSAAGITFKEPVEQRKAKLEAVLADKKSLKKFADELGIGEPTLKDIFEQILRPGRDPRQDVPLPILRKDVLKMEDLSTGMRLHGTVRNVVDFGAFVDIGVKQDGLLHRTQVPMGVILSVGDIIEIEIEKVEIERGRIALKWAG